MQWNIMFFVNSILLGIGLAMDAFSVSLANGLAEPQMKRRKLVGIAGVFAFFQALMPMIGWLCVHLFIKFFTQFQKFIPWIALVLLLYIGGSMIYGAVKKKDGDDEPPKVGFLALLVQGIATSIDALSVGFTISEYGTLMALVCALIIAGVTFIICVAGLTIGKKFGTKLSDKATIFGGIILILIGIEIFVTGII
ncbi:MAG: manganese efflux pump [Clostridia bacterium]|nr:manganese efflux pump [Clostridia bacterium]